MAETFSSKIVDFISAKTPAASGPSEEQQWWAYACAAAETARAGELPPAIQVYGPVLDPDEIAFFHSTAGYARMYGGDGTYSKTGFLALGRPALVAGTLAASAYVNHRRKVAARRDAMVQWREHQHVSVIGTSHRLMVNTPQNGWMSFWYGGVSEYYPDPATWSLTLGFDGQTPPLRLVGPPIPAAGLIVAIALTGERFVDDPRLAPLLTAGSGV